MTPRWFRLTISDELLRRMTREQYYTTRSYMRLCERRIAGRIDEKEIDRCYFSAATYGLGFMKQIV